MHSFMINIKYISGILVFLHFISKLFVISVRNVISGVMVYS